MATATARAEIELAKKEASMRIASANQRRKASGTERMLVRKATLVGTAGVYGVLNRMGVPVEIAGFPVKLAISTAANLAEAMTGGNTQAVMAGIADATTAIYVERSITTGTVIAGDYEVGAEDDEIIEVEADDGGQLD